MSEYGYKYTEFIYGNEVLYKQQFPNDFVVKTINGQREKREKIVRCKDCIKSATASDGRMYCTWHSHIVPENGFCWKGEE